MGSQGMVKPDLTADLAFAHELADLAASVTMGWFGDRLAVELKEDATPVTEVDRATERAIREAIAARFPDDAVLGEEHGSMRGTSGRRWIVDPVDGTKLYAEGIPLWTTLIGLEVDTRVVLGVADAPALGDRYVGISGQGAWRGSQRLHVSTVSRLRDAFVTHSAADEWIAGGREALLEGVARGARRTRGLSDAWGQLLVAQGSVEALLEHEPCEAWDWSATKVIVEEAGGRLSMLDGSPPTSGGDLLVSNGAVHEEILAVLGSVGRTFASDGGTR
jgi:histidinol-phosphatase